MKPNQILPALFPVLLLTLAPNTTATQARFGILNEVSEWSYHSAKEHADPFNDLELNVIVTDPKGGVERVPAFWAGGLDWTVRYAPHMTGTHHFQTVCSDPGDAGLQGQEGTLEIGPYTGSNPLYEHGAIRVAADHRHFEHSDGTLFFGWATPGGWDSASGCIGRRILNC